MSHGATSTQSMAFSNAAHSFNNIGHTNMNDKKSNANGSLNAAFGGKGVWGSNSIWGGGLSNGLTPAHTTRDNSMSRDTAPQSAASQPEEFEGKTGSGSLVESSVSEAYANRSGWGAKRGTASGRSMPNGRYPDSNVHQQRSASNAGLPSMTNSTQNGISFISRPPTISLNATASSQPRQSFSTTFAGGMNGRGSEQPPFNVYTKFDRPSDPTQRKQLDSAIGSWPETTSTPSPNDERRPQFPISYCRNASMPASRDGSLPPSRAEDAPPMFNRPDYGRASQRVTPNSSRAPSISSTRNGTFNPYFNVGADQMASQFGQLSINGDSRPNTSYKQSTPFSSARPSLPSTRHSFDRHEDVEELERSSVNYLGLDDHPSRQSDNQLSAAFVERYLSGPVYEFRPGQPYMGNSAAYRAYDMQGGSRSHSEWQALANGHVSSRRSPAMPEQQHQPYLDPRVQHLMSAQLRNPYAAMYNPYALQLNSPYMGLVQLGPVGLDMSPAQRESPVGDGVQSALMYEFKSNTKTKRYELRDIYDHIAEFSGDQHGSRFIQTKLETANSDEKERVFAEIEPNAIPLMTDVFGNYVIQKFFEHGDQTHKKILANKMRGQVLTLSLQMYGCRVVQKALDHVLVDQQALLISELENHVLRCVKDQNGNHVIQKAIERCPAKTIGFIIAAFQGQVQHLSIHTYGCRVIQRCLEKCDLPSRNMIMAELLEGIPSMISDQFGNYVVQHIVCHDDGVGKQRVLDTVARGLEGYSRHKFASNVVEKCLERGDDSWRQQVTVLLANANSRRTEGEGVLVGMIKDNFGNYVIQKLLDTLSTGDYHFFLEHLQPAMVLAKRTGCGKQTLSIEKKMHRFDSYRTGGHIGGSNSNSSAAFNRPGPAYGLPFPTPQFAGNYNSAATTPPPPLTADTQSLQSSGLPSINGDAVEGAAAGGSRKGSEPSSVHSIDGVHR